MGFTVSLRQIILALILTFVGTLTLLCTFVLVASFLGLDDVAESLSLSLHGQVKKETDEILNQPVTAARLLAKDLIVSDLDKADGENEQWYLDLFRKEIFYSYHLNISAVYLALADGCISLTAHHNNSRHYYLSSPFSSFEYREYDILVNTSTHHSARHLSLRYTVTKKSYNHATTRPYYLSTFNAPDTGRFADIFVSRSRHIFALPYCVPIRYQNGTWMGCACADYTLEALSEQLKRVPVGKTGQAFIIDGQSNLVASSKESIACLDNMMLHHVVNASDPVTADAGRFLEKNTVVQGKRYSVGLAGKEFFMSVSPIQLTGLDWRVFVLIPRADYFSLMDLVTILCVTVSIVIFVVAVALGCGCTQMISTRMNRIATEIGRVVSYQDNAFVSQDSARKRHAIQLKEVQYMQDSVTRMKVILQSFEKYIPVQLLRYLIRQNQPAVLGLKRASATVMFLDVVNFTTIMESCNLNELIEQFTEYNNEVIRIIMENNGTLDKMMGDGIMAFFGCPPSRLGDHETWACRAALQIQV